MAFLLSVGVHEHRLARVSLVIRPRSPELLGATSNSGWQMPRAYARFFVSFIHGIHHETPVERQRIMLHETKSYQLTRHILAGVHLKGEELRSMARFCRPEHKLVVVALSAILTVPLAMAIAVPQLTAQGRILCMAHAWFAHGI